MSVTDKAMWRSVRKEEFPDGVSRDGKPAPGVLYPAFEPRLIESTNRIRPADVDTFSNQEGTFVRSGGGTSLFDRNNVFGAKYWFYFNIPHGTEVPDSLHLRGPDYNSRYEANHYQIEPRARIMRVDAYKGALDNFARNAIARAVEAAR